MSIAALIARFGLPAVALGAAVEGETVVMTGGLIAHQGLMPLSGVMAAAAIGSFVADQFFFLLGRRFRMHRLVRKVTERKAFARVLKLLERYPTGFILAFRFLYGLRTISPIAIGTSNIPARRFVALNALAAAVWGVVIAGIGYSFGQVVELAFGHLRRFGHVALAVFALVAVATALTLLFRRRLSRAIDTDET
nr:DedA family protein [uncultured Novosphingobium sp.]